MDLIFQFAFQLLLFSGNSCMFTCILGQNEFVIVFMQRTFFTCFCWYFYLDVWKIIMVIFAIILLVYSLIHAHSVVFQVHKKLFIVIGWFGWDIQILIIVWTIVLQLFFYLRRCLQTRRFNFRIRNFLTEFRMGFVGEFCRVQ